MAEPNWSYTHQNIPRCRSARPKAAYGTRSASRALSCDRDRSWAPAALPRHRRATTALRRGPAAGPRETDDVPHLAGLRQDAGPRLAELPCTLVWATTWLEDANTEIAPRLGLPDLPVVTWPEPTGAHEREDQWFGLCWKTRTLVVWAAGRPFAWVDNEITDADRDWVSAHHPGLALDGWLRELP